MNRNHFVYKLIPPRATFAVDMTDTEQAVMGEHAAYWTNLFEEGTVVLFGVVMEEAGAWGLAVVEADDEDEVRGLASDDPAVKTNLCTFAIGVMPDPSVRPRRTAASSRRSAAPSARSSPRSSSSVPSSPRTHLGDLPRRLPELLRPPPAHGRLRHAGRVRPGPAR